MINYKQLAQAAPIYIMAFIGISKDEFEILLPAFQEAWDDYVRKNFIERKGRERAFGGGNKEKLINIEDKLLFILFYNKVYPPQTVITFIFGMSQSQACEWIHRLSEVLNAAFEKRGNLPARNEEDCEKIA
ncbi:MAG: transposase family protein [Gammaproteobacteria bacterium]|nr:transposase family protein [Gammaproteobacteria bacterium]